MEKNLKMNLLLHQEPRGCVRINNCCWFNAISQFLSSTRSELFYEIVAKYIKFHGCGNTYCWNCIIFTFMLNLMMVNDESNFILNCSDDIFKFPAIIIDSKTKKELNHPFS